MLPNLEELKKNGFYDKCDSYLLNWFRKIKSLLTF